MNNNTLVPIINNIIFKLNYLTATWKTEHERLYSSHRRYLTNESHKW